MAAIINNYADAAALFAKARRPEKGKPLDAQHWRLFKDGDEFVLNYLSVQVARILPSNTLIVTGYGANNPPQGMIATAERALPIRIIRRGAGDYRLHAVMDPDDYDMSKKYGVADWRGMMTGGVHLWHDAAFDLTNRVWLTEPEVTKTIDKLADKEWRAKSTHVKKVLAAMIKLGAIDARIRAKADADEPWYKSASLTRPSKRALAVMLDAVKTGVVSEDLADLFAQSCRRKNITGPDVPDQLRHLSAIFKRHSLTLRTALGVVTIK